MPTVGDIISATEPLIARKIRTTLPSTFYDGQIYQWIKNAYDRITDEVRIPTASAVIPLVASQSAYNLPNGTDYTAAPKIWDGIDGILHLQYNGTPIMRGYVLELQDLYGVDWQNPPGWSLATQDGSKYCEYDDDTKLLLVPQVGTDVSSKSMKLVYVTPVALPASHSTAVPVIFEPYVNAIPDYLWGLALEVDKDGRGAAQIAKFEALLQRHKRIKNRKGEKPKVRQTQAYRLDLYNRRYMSS